MKQYAIDPNRKTVVAPKVNESPSKIDRLENIIKAQDINIRKLKSRLVKIETRVSTLSERLRNISAKVTK